MPNVRVLFAPVEGPDDPIADTPPDLIEALLDAASTLARELGADARPTAAPDWIFQPGREGKGETSPAPPLVSLRATTSESGRELREILERIDLSTDPRIEAQTDSVLNSDDSVPAARFGSRDEALALIGAAPPVIGTNLPVHVVIVDQGFDAARFPPQNFGGGWFVPGGPSPGKGNSDHAAMIAAAVLLVAPNAILFDVPLIPTPAPGAAATINNIPTFALEAGALFHAFNWHLHKQGPTASWVFVNAWSIYDTTTDAPSVRKYTTDPKHYLNRQIAHLVNRRKADVVFAAGNCGQFDPDWRCGRSDRGPCHSIWGGNSLDGVLTVGAVRTDRSWTGFSSQGPGQPLLGVNKPDLCAPSEFAADDDDYYIFGGTSGACAVAAGVVAALRFQRDQTMLDPIGLIKQLRNTATPPRTNEDQSRLGAGIINLRRAQFF